jgi:hypothetical protein
MFALGCLVAAGIVGSGRLGADVGGVVTLGAGGAGAVLTSLGGRLTRRRLMVAALVPVTAVVALALLDVVTSGDAHLTRTVLHGGGFGSLLDIAHRRLTISAKGLLYWPVAVTCAIGVVAFWFGIRRRQRLFAPIADYPSFVAAMWGAFWATVIGSLSNDSGPVMFALGFLGLLFATGYVRGRPAEREGTASPASRAPSGGGRPRARPRVREPAS